jgi:ATP-binding protein involved in chromosome partitioning
MIAEQSIREALRAVIDPEIRRNVVELDMVRGVGVRGDHVDVTIALTVAGCPMKADLEGQVRRHVGAVDGVASVGVAFDVMTPEERTALRQRLHPGGGDGGEQKAISLSKRTRVVALASGKGGVGKSTLSVNLAAALAAGGAEVGVVDADIHGYSLPRMLGVSRRPVVVDKMIVPPVAHDLRVMSIGFFLDSEQAVVWRGPMLHRALEQFLTDVHWGELDYLVVDMPPGTGDVAAKTGMRVAGVVENMSFIRCACCGEVSHPFGSGGGRALAEELGVPLLAEIPIDEPLREAADGGTPLVVSSPEAESAQAVAALAEALPGALRPRSGAERISRRLGVLS